MHDTCPALTLLPQFVYRDSIWWLVQVKKLLNVQFSAFSCYFLHLPHNPILEHPQFMFFP